jgi:recombinational DNA repair ATPase RecF
LSCSLSDALLICLSVCVTAKLQELQDAVRNTILQSLQGAQDVVKNIEKQLVELASAIERACVQLCDESAMTQVRLTTASTAFPDIFCHHGG